MTLTPIQLLIAAAELGLKLGMEPGDTLTVEPAAKCPRDFAATLKAHKWSLLPFATSRKIFRSAGRTATAAGYGIAKACGGDFARF